MVFQSDGVIHIPTSSCIHYPLLPLVFIKDIFLTKLYIIHDTFILKMKTLDIHTFIYQPLLTNRKTPERKFYMLAPNLTSYFH